MFYSERLRSVVAIRRQVNGRTAPVGSGLFVSLGGRRYLVTCRHVVPNVIIGDDCNGYARGVVVFPGPLCVRLKAKDNQRFIDIPVEIFDSGKKRKWRSFPYEDRPWDVAVFELNESVLSGFDVKWWREDEMLGAEESLAAGEAIRILSHAESSTGESVPEDRDTEMESLEKQIWSSDLGGITSNPLYYGASGSLVYRFVKESDQTPEEETRIQAVGIFTGAVPIENAQGGHFHYIQTAAAIIHAERDCLDNIGLSFESE
jgi:hypothetical protein